MTTENVESDIRERIERFFSPPGDSVDAELVGQRLGESTDAVASAMLSFIAMACDVKLERLDETNEQALSAEEPTTVAIVTTTRFADSLSVAVPHSSVHSLVGLMYGEPEEAVPIKPSRPLTELEVHVVQDIATSLTEGLLGELVGPVQATDSSAATLGMEDVDEAELQALGVSVDKQFARFEFSFGSREAFPIYIGFPASMLQEIQALLVEAIQSEDDGAEETSNPEWSNKIKSKIDDAQVEVIASIVCPDATLAAIAALRPGHVVEIYQTNNSLVTLECDNEPIYRGSLGKVSGRLAVEVEAGVDHWNEFLCEMLFEADQS